MKDKDDNTSNNGLRRDFGVFIKGVHKPQETENLEKGLKIMLNKFMENKRTIRFLQWRCKHYMEQIKKLEELETRMTKGDTLISFQKLEYYKNVEVLYFKNVAPDMPLI